MAKGIDADGYHSPHELSRASPPGPGLHQCHASSSQLLHSPSSSQSQLVPATSFHVATPPPPPPPPSQQIALSAPGNTAQLFDASSDNTITNSTVKVAGRDLINLSVSIHAVLPSHGPGQQAPDTMHQPSYSWPSILSRFRSPFSGTSVTLNPAMDASHEPQPTQSPAPICPAPRDAQVPDIQDTPATQAGDLQTSGRAYRDAQAGGPEPLEDTGSDDFDIISLEDLDISGEHRAKLFPPKSMTLPKASNLHEIYVRNIYPSGHGYPCANPRPMRLPIRIGDVGMLTSSGFAVLTNLYDCPSSSLRNHLSSLPSLSDVWQNPEYLLEGESITGGVSDCETNHAVENSTIREIKYRCQDLEGAILAVTSPAQLLSLTDHAPLRDWLCIHGMDLFQSLRPGRADPLYVVTGTVTSSSWATATYAEPMKAPYDSLVLTHLSFQDPSSQPSYRWTRTGKAQARSRTSTTIDPTGERAKDQCLFLRGFLLSPSMQHILNRGRYTVRKSDGKAASGSDLGTGDVHSLTNSLESVGGGSLGSASFSKGSHRGVASEEAVLLTEPGYVSAKVAVNEVPSLTSTELYPSHMINKRLLELTKADLAITHDDDWRCRLHDIRQQSMTSAKGSGVPPPSLLLEAKNELAQGNEAQFGSTATTKHAEGIPDESGSPRSISTQLQPEHSKLAQASISWRFVPRRSQISARGGALTQDDAIAGTSGISTKFGRGDPITVRSNTVSRTSARTHTAKDQMTGGASANTREAKGKTAAGSNMHARAQVPHNSPSLRYITTAVTPQGHLGRQLPTTFTGSHDGDEATISDSHVKAFKIICQSICGGSAIITATASSDGKFMAIASLQNGGTTVMLGHALGLSKGSAEQAAALAACRSLYEQYPGQILLSQDKTFIPAKASTGEYSLIS